MTTAWSGEPIRSCIKSRRSCSFSTGSCSFPRVAVRFSAVPTFLIYPALYIGWTFVYGAISGWYAYPFVNARRLSLAGLALNFAGLVCIAVLTIPCALVALNKLLDRAEADRRWCRGSCVVFVASLVAGGSGIAPWTRRLPWEPSSG